MNSHSLGPWLVLTSALFFLTGCPRDEAPPKAAVLNPTYLAVARGRIDVEGGLLKLGVTRDGVVVDIKVKEGDHVKRGQLLASLDSELSRLAVHTAQAEQQRVKDQNRQLERRFKFADEKAKRLMAAATAGAGDIQSADDAREAAEQLRDDIEKNHGEAEMAARKLTTANYELAQRSLYAPFEAEVVRRLIQPGATVSPQSGPSFILLPNEARIVRAELNESFTGVVTPGMKAYVSNDSDNGLPPLSAHVVRISAVLGNSTLEDDPLVRANMRMVECILALDQPPPTSLRVGQRMLVRFGAQ